MVTSLRPPLPEDSLYVSADSLVALGVLCTRATLPPGPLPARAWEGRVGEVQVRVTYFDDCGEMAWQVLAVTRSGRITRTVAVGHGATFEAADTDAQQDFAAVARASATLREHARARPMLDVGIETSRLGVWLRGRHRYAVGSDDRREAGTAIRWHVRRLRGARATAKVAAVGRPSVQRVA